MLNDQSLDPLNDWIDAIDRTLGVDVMYFDFQKAADKIPHKK